ncbi:NADH-quinone oxidoreductase subunit NuoF [Ethanoligenens harbinense]|uniref:NADH dehydrogenase (Quinone) n=1 Tax=Ethanoligenens harbinense (strain DSM 18485 / JCM 12961 / CGMCC 1.5033 / YUAN-3) TaxID=663278 RepID=E6U738_ETHHY|nr:NADH-quinone oxidoreductase subunit NuoF [Ethanoligenens harbinense]ADU28108.1 NADH dehydrogenase (quinone) [Ethanoligenens harbinense YUAN-3]AVQ97117.1 NADH-quinone oxidoreductase subunit F [Ethanoligenens harbinense YUAN-3]AYF39779.1 NADH-quinone oxidoreductase subunit F [Ethanoligenens harbinense]AYF42611.1 NADH-quinone oxidoreductase subunit F [Ethanoligenens harbinense]QCN93360.1 NADH-quinone oxidoreductase subunit F [Ethanoligenens harbinense]
MKLETAEQLDRFSHVAGERMDKQQLRVSVCAGTGCLAGGSLEFYERLRAIVAEKGLLVDVRLEKEPEHGIGVHKSGCHGFCEMGPIVRIEPAGYLYLRVKPEDAEEIAETTLFGGKPVERLLYKEGEQTFAKQEDIPFYSRQTRLVLHHCGDIDAESIDEYIAMGGYQAFRKALFTMEPADVCRLIKLSNLRGRGGGGYPAGSKWEQVLSRPDEIKYVVCNGDEGDPGAFMDRSVMEGDPHSVLEGMLIAGFATKATQGYIYVRAEYPVAVERLNKAIEAARGVGLLGENILGSGFSFDIRVNRGAGAFVCGEGSALTASIEGKRGMPRVKPPRTTEHGLWNRPTVLNNVETFANVPRIVQNGGDWFRGIGPENSPGTKVFAISGNVNNTGLIEVPMGTTLREVIFDIGGGIRGGKAFKAVQIGGPSGGCLTSEHLDLPLDFDSLKKVGAMIGSGGLVVMDEDTCMVEVARFFMNFTQNESCGKCVPCREGTRRMLEILTRIVEGKGEMEDLDMLEELADTISNTALCGLGKSAANPVVSTLKYFRDEYIAHVRDKKCPTHTCKAMSIYAIDPEACKGCSKCSRICPVGAISGEIRHPFTIDTQKCIKCGACIANCPFHAIKEA